MQLSKRLDYRHIVGAVVLLALGVWMRRADWLDIVKIFVHDPEASHIVLVLPVAARLFWVRRERLRRVQFKTSWLGVLLVAAGAVVCFLGEDRGYDGLRHIGALVVAVGCVVTMLGRNILVNFAPVFFVLILLIPMPPSFRQRISLPLMPIMAQISQMFLEAFGAAVTRSGNQLNVNGKDLLIVEACNGLRGLFTMTLVSYLVAFSMSLKPWARILVVAMSPVSAIVMNVLRIMLVAWMMGPMEHEVWQVFHDLLGWAMLPAMGLMIFAVVWALKWAMVPVSDFTLARD